jgi:hypothetical protein
VLNYFLVIMQRFCLLLDFTSFWLGSCSQIQVFMHIGIFVFVFIVYESYASNLLISTTVYIRHCNIIHHFYNMNSLCL